MLYLEICRTTSLRNGKKFPRQKNLNNVARRLLLESELANSVVKSGSLTAP